MPNVGRWWTIRRNFLNYSRRSSANKPADIKGSRAYVESDSVGAVKKALKGCSGIKKVRSSTGGLVEIVHTNNKSNCYQMIRALKEAEFKVVSW